MVAAVAGSKSCYSVGYLQVDATKWGMGTKDGWWTWEY
jgi:hypothetical protein